MPSAPGSQCLLQFGALLSSLASPQSQPWAWKSCPCREELAFLRTAQSGPVGDRVAAGGSGDEQVGGGEAGWGGGNHTLNRHKWLSHSAAKTTMTIMKCQIYLSGAWGLLMGSLVQREGVEVGKILPPTSQPRNGQPQPLPHPVSGCRGRPRAGKGWEERENRQPDCRAQGDGPRRALRSGEGAPITTSIRPWKAAVEMRVRAGNCLWHMENSRSITSWNLISC